MRFISLYIFYLQGKIKQYINDIKKIVSNHIISLYVSRAYNDVDLYI